MLPARPLPVALAGTVPGLLAGAACTHATLLALPALLLAAALPAARSLALGLALGLVLAAAHARERARWPPAAEAWVEVAGHVLSCEPPGPGGQRFVLAVHPPHGEGPRLDVHWAHEGATGLWPGDRVRALLELQARRAPRSPGERDTRAWLDRQGLWTRARAEGPQAVVRVTGGEGASHALARLRAAAGAQLAQHLPATDAGLARALLLGDRSALSRRDVDLFRHSGQGHLVAVSGQHVVLVLGAVLVLARALHLPHAARLALGLLVLLAYVPLAGAAPSAVRSGLSGGLWLLARMGGREGAALDVICATALLMLAADPAALHDAGFTLSFAAVLGIELLAPRLADAWGAHPRRVPGVMEPRRPRLRLALAVGLAAWLAGAPLAQCLFGTLAPASALVALLAVPLAAVLLGVATGVLCVGGLPLAGEALVVLFGQVAALLRAWLAAPPHVGLQMLEGPPPGAGWLFACVVLLAVACAGPRRLLGASLVAVAALMMAALEPRGAGAPRHPEALALEAPRAHCVLLRVPDGRSLLLCSGGPALGPVLRWDLPAALQALGLARLDLAWHASEQGEPHPLLAALAAAGQVGRVQGARHERPCDPGVHGPWGRLEAGRSGGRATLDLVQGAQRVRLLPAPDTSAGALRLVTAPGRGAAWNAWATTVPGAAPAEYPAPAMLAPMPLDPGSLGLLGLALGAFAVACVRPLRWLGAGGAAAAFVLGMACSAALGWPALAALLAPFVAATLLGKLPGRPREPGRSAVQVACNGLPALLGAVLALAGLREAGAAVLVGGLACLGADTCATEVGTRYGGPPRSLWGGRTLEPGESGGVTTAGLLASLLGACLAPLAYGFLHGGLGWQAQAWLAAAGAAGALLDSLLGATLQFRGRAPDGSVREQRRLDGVALARVRGWRWLDNDAVNLASGLAAGLLAWALLAA